MGGAGSESWTTPIAGLASWVRARPPQEHRRESRTTTKASTMGANTTGAGGAALAS